MYPQHEKAITVKAKSQAIGEFLDWLETEGITLARPDTNVTRDGCWCLPIHEPHEDLLARYFEIDLVVLEAEKRAMLSIQAGGADGR
jgi:hypothetical protein